MEAGKTVREPAQPVAGWSRTLNVINPLRAVWWLVTNVRFAILLLVLMAVISLVGVLIPQVPSNVRGDPTSEANWLQLQHGRFGFLTPALHDTGIFDVFHQRWFGLLLAVTVVSTGAYVISRFPGIWTSIRRPRKRVPDRYLELAPHRLQVDGSVDADRLESLLRAKRYKVERTEEGGATYLFADRFQIAQLGTLLTHAAIIVFVLSAVVRRVDAYSAPMFLAEGTTQPVFPVSNPNQIQVQLTKSYARFADDGEPLDYRADLTIYSNGQEAVRCSSTVNSPCTYKGFKFYEEAYFGYGAGVTVRDVATGNVVYNETLALAAETPSPRVRITGGDGSVLYDETVVMPDSVDAGDGTTYRAGLVKLSDGRPLTFWLPKNAGDTDKLVVFEPGGGGNTVQASVAKGETAQSGGLNIAYTGLVPVPTQVIDGFPLPQNLGEGPSGQALLELSNVVQGTGQTSAGNYVSPGGAPGVPTLTVVGLQAQAVTLKPGESVTVGGLQYTFDGQKEFAGIEARRDRSDLLVWIGAAAIVLGLAITFWVPRRRLWAKITAARTAMAGQAPSHANFTRELRSLAREAGAPIAEEADDDD
ncbi:MAG TPA: cytochrome c biogenesis protein ResB [Dehalococcoidia bacterium]